MTVEDIVRGLIDIADQAPMGMNQDVEVDGCREFRVWYDEVRGVVCVSSPAEWDGL